MRHKDEVSRYVNPEWLVEIEAAALLEYEEEWLPASTDCLEAVREIHHPRDRDLGAPGRLHLCAGTSADGAPAPHAEPNRSAAVTDPHRGSDDYHDTHAASSHPHTDASASFPDDHSDTHPACSHRHPHTDVAASYPDDHHDTHTACSHPHTDTSASYPDDHSDTYGACSHPHTDDSAPYSDPHADRFPTSGRGGGVRPSGALGSGLRS